MTENTVPVLISTPTGEVNVIDTTLPDSGRTFRDAWRVEGAVITVDMDAARDIVRDKIRMARMPYLLALDVRYMKASENGEPVTDIVAHKQWLRDLPADVRIEQAPDDVALAELLDGMMGEMEARDV